MELKWGLSGLVMWRRHLSKVDVLKLGLDSSNNKSAGGGDKVAAVRAL